LFDFFVHFIIQLQYRIFIKSLIFLLLQEGLQCLVDLLVVLPHYFHQVVFLFREVLLRHWLLVQLLLLKPLCHSLHEHLLLVFALLKIFLRQLLLYLFNHFLRKGQLGSFLPLYLL